MLLDRYSRPHMSKIWSDENRFSLYLEIEKLVSLVEAENSIIPEDAANIISSIKNISVDRIYELDKELKHETLSFLTAFSEEINKVNSDASKFLHYGLTSSDLLDTGFSLQLRESIKILIEDVSLLLASLKKKSFEYKDAICIGRSHGMHGEPITFGLKMAYAYAEFKRHLERLNNTQKQVSVCMISGPMGNYSALSPVIQDSVADKLGLQSELISTQVIARDRFAEYFCVLGLIASSVERLATEIRHLQRTEVNEVSENFSSKQKGSSAMPHKKNPILSENLCGLARIVKSAINPSLENVVLWHERDMSHSSVERILAPEVSILSDFMLSRLNDVIANLNVNVDQMKKNLEIDNYSFMSHHQLLSLIKSGMSREEAYRNIQKCYFNSSYSREDKVDFLPYLKHVDYIFSRVFVD